MKEIILVIATLFGVYLGSYLNDEVTQKNIHNENIRSTLLDIVTKAELRVHSMQNVAWSATAKNVFRKRWDTYIETGVVPWESSYYRMKIGLNNYAENVETIKIFEELNQLFKKEHKAIEEEVFKKNSNNKPINKESLNRINTRLKHLKEVSNYLSFLILYELEDNPVSIEHFGESRG